MVTSKYECVETLSGHTGSIIAVCFSPDGEYLASACDDGIVLITATESWETVRKLVNVSPVAAIIWDPTFPMTVVCGFDSGAVVTVYIGDTDVDRSEHKVWVDMFDGPIHYISLDGPGRILAVAHGCDVTLLNQKTLSRWENLRTLPDPPEFTSDLPAPDPRTLHFTNDGKLIGAFLNHGIVCWDTLSTDVLWHIVPRSRRIGWSAISPEGTHIVVWNLFDGLDFYSIADRVLSHSTPCPINQQNNKPVPVLFNGDGSIIIVGGTFGSIRVMDSSSYETLQVLSHDGDLIQAIDSCMTEEGMELIAAGVSELEAETTIKIWASKPVSLSSPAPTLAFEPRPVDTVPGRSLSFSILVALLPFCCFFVTTHSDLWAQWWRGFLVQLVKYTEKNA